MPNLCSKPTDNSASTTEQAHEHPALVVLRAEEDGEDAKLVPVFVNQIPVDRAVDGQMTKAGDQVVMRGPAFGHRHVLAVKINEMP